MSTIHRQTLAALFAKASAVEAYSHKRSKYAPVLARFDGHDFLVEGEGVAMRFHAFPCPDTPWFLFSSATVNAHFPEKGDENYSDVEVTEAGDDVLFDGVSFHNAEKLCGDQFASSLQGHVAVADTTAAVLDALARASTITDKGDPFPPYMANVFVEAGTIRATDSRRLIIESIGDAETGVSVIPADASTLLKKLFGGKDNASRRLSVSGLMDRANPTEAHGAVFHLSPQGDELTIASLHECRSNNIPPMGRCRDIVNAERGFNRVVLPPDFAKTVERVGKLSPKSIVRIEWNDKGQGLMSPADDKSVRPVAFRVDADTPYSACFNAKLLSGAFKAAKPDKKIGLYANVPENERTQMILFNRRNVDIDIAVMPCTLA